jgi:hypothetical protein
VQVAEHGGVADGQRDQLLAGVGRKLELRREENSRQGGKRRRRVRGGK